MTGNMERLADADTTRQHMSEPFRSVCRTSEISHYASEPLVA